MAELSSQFSDWMQTECERLETARQNVKHRGFTEKTHEALFRAAHDIKGEAATFGYPEAAGVAESLCRLLEHTPRAGAHPDQAGRPARRCGARDHPRTCPARRRQCRQRADAAAARGHRRFPPPRERASARIIWKAFSLRRSLPATPGRDGLRRHGARLAVRIRRRQARRRTAAPLRARLRSRTGATA